MQSIEFAAVGDNCIDRFLPPVNDCLVGGNAVNVAVQLALLGRRVGYFGAVGDDPAGDAVRVALIANAVSVEHLQVIAGERTAYTDIEVSEDGERSFVFEEFGTSALYRPASADVPVIASARHVHIGWLNDGGDLKRRLAGKGPTLSQDLTVNAAPENLSPEGLDIAFCSAEPEQAARVAEGLLARGARLAVVTLGAAGSLATDGRLSATASAPLIVPEDTTGAGDAFIAGFLDAYAKGQAIEACLREGTERAARACMHRGGFPQKPLKGILAV